MLSSLVQFKNRLVDTLQGMDINQSILDQHTAFINLQHNHTCNYDTHFSTIFEKYNQMASTNKEAIHECGMLLHQVETDIQALVDSHADEFVHTMTDMHDETAFMESISDETFDLIKGRIGAYSNWKYPALLLGCRNKAITDLLVASDPLYVTNTQNEYLQKVVTAYHPDYQRRLRPYHLQLNQLTSTLPNKQFNVILAWDILNYTSMTEITQIMTDAFQLLRPGGTFMFSYNNCDIVESAELAECKAMSYTNSKSIINAAKSIGYWSVRAENYPNPDTLYSHVSWIELHKQGRLSTVKAHQILGKIIPK